MKGNKTSSLFSTPARLSRRKRRSLQGKRRNTHNFLHLSPRRVLYVKKNKPPATHREGYRRSEMRPQENKKTRGKARRKTLFPHHTAGIPACPPVYETRQNKIDPPPRSTPSDNSKHPSDNFPRRPEAQSQAGLLHDEIQNDPLPRRSAVKNAIVHDPLKA